MSNWYSTALMKQGYSLNFRATQDSAKTSGLLKTDAHFRHNYRCNQLICGYVNDCIGEVFMPGQFLFTMTIAVLSISGLIRMGSAAGPILCAGAVIFLLLLIVYFNSFIGKGSELLEMSYTLVQSKKNTCDRKDMAVFLESCSPFKAKVGPFLHLQKSLILDIFATIIDYTVTLLLL